jgi:hypothetical protein
VSGGVSWSRTNVDLKKLNHLGVGLLESPSAVSRSVESFMHTSSQYSHFTLSSTQHEFKCSSFVVSHLQTYKKQKKTFNFSLNWRVDSNVLPHGSLFIFNQLVFNILRHSFHSRSTASLYKIYTTRIFIFPAFRITSLPTSTASRKTNPHQWKIIFFLLRNVQRSCQQ